jgi:hypothetical protein
MSVPGAPWTNSFGRSTLREKHQNPEDETDASSAACV